MIASPEAQKHQRIAVVDALRGLAATAVVCHHVFTVFGKEAFDVKPGAPWLYDCWNWISDQNASAVLLFFVLSGFAIRLSLRSGLAGCSQDPTSYLARRAFRILPLYWLALAWTAALGWLAFGTDDPSFSSTTLAGNVAFLQTSVSARGTWFSPYGLNGPLWSLSYEVFYYLLLPVIAVALGRLSDRQREASILVCASLVVSLLAVGFGLWAPSPFSAFFSYWHVWVLGFVLADSWKRGSSFPYPLVSFLFLAFLAQAAAMNGLASSTLEGLQTGAGIATIGYLLMFAAAKGLSKPIHALGSGLNALFGRLGRGSYALYLLHYPLLLATAAVLTRVSVEGAAIRLWLALAIVATFAFIVCPALEKNILRLKPLFFRARGPAPRLETL